ncbi:amidoligase family protein [Parahaliea mediterranea]|uniref:Amidoligase family protein n=1 Tax=Parahaliea mediterranea TaxID=651086 RepID=A0A939DD29_9GAMM|nr:amidoligase family protein [Parahaliea mediterranea]
MNTRCDDNYRAGLWPLPPRTRTSAGGMRRVGVEIEFAGLAIERIAELVVAELGGRAHVISPYEQQVAGTVLGDIGLELDYSYLKRLGRERDPTAEVNELDQLGESLLKLLAEQVVPYEIVTAPIAMSGLWRLGELLTRLRLAGARGTNHAPIYAFGLHLNHEMPDLSAATILAYLRAFLCLYEWLLERSHVNLSRRLTPYIDPFPRDYVKRVIAEDYAPDLAGLIDDYLRYNPTRNRALDLLPLFSHIDPERVRAVVDDDRVKARPALHYRLPNCQVDEPNWSLARPWRDWLQVEVLACDPSRLERIRRGYRRHLNGPVGGLFQDWPEACSRWLLPELL